MRTTRGGETHDAEPTAARYIPMTTGGEVEYVAGQADALFRCIKTMAVVFHACLESRKEIILLSKTTN